MKRHATKFTQLRWQIEEYFAAKANSRVQELQIYSEFIPEWMMSLLLFLKQFMIVALLTSVVIMLYRAYFKEDVIIQKNTTITIQCLSGVNSTGDIITTHDTGVDLLLNKKTNGN